ncbi:unnamed protein product [Phyllotreta striolata]|uniref:Separase n=1 Tax=Phyllotreta striolata TaxID=444603 RepID=A0A9N9XTB5_PHYSR|nr:unnamed protein product [Phyllotreta striolata]
MLINISCLSITIEAQFLITFECSKMSKSQKRAISSKIVASTIKLDIFNKCKEGSFKEALNCINSDLKKHLTKETVLSIIKYCAAGCCAKDDLSSPSSLIKLLTILRQFLTSLDEPELVNYLYSMSYILRFFIKKNLIESLLEMEDFILDNSHPPLTDTGQEVFYAIMVTLVKLVIRSSNTTPSNEKQLQETIKLSKLVLKMCTKLDAKKAIDFPVTCLSCIIKMNASLAEQIEYCDLCFEMIDFSKVDAGNNFKNVASTFVHLTKNILVSQEISRGIEFFDTIAMHLKNKTKNNHCLNCLVDFLKFFTIMKAPDMFIIIEKSLASLKKLDLALKEASYKKEFYLNICSLFPKMMSYYKLFPTDLSSLTEDQHTRFLTFLVCVNSIFTKSVSDAADKTYITLVMSGGIISAISIYAQNKNCHQRYHQFCCNLLNKYFKQIKTKLDHTHKDLGQYWNYFFAKLNDLCCYLKSEKEIAIRYSRFMINLFLELEDVRVEVILKQKTIYSICYMLINLHSDDVKKQLAYCSLGVFLCENYSKDFMDMWVQIKYRSKGSNDVKGLNILSALSLLYQEYPDIDVLKNDKIRLLNMELLHYNKKWRSKLPITNALNELIQIADIDNIEKVVINLYKNMDIPNYDQVFDIVQNIIKKYQQPIENNRSRLNLSILHYIIYKCSCMKKVAKNDVPKVIESCPTKVADNEEADDEKTDYFCESLKFQVLNERLKDLELSFELLTLSVPTLKLSDLEHIELKDIHDILMRISFEFKLIRCDAKCLKTLEMSLEVSKLMNEHPRILRSISHIIEHPDIDEKVLKELMELADETLGNINAEQCENLKIIINFHICKCKALFYRNQEESYKSLKKIEELCKNMDDQNGSNQIMGQLYLLHSKFDSLPCNLAMDKRRSSVIFNVTRAVKILTLDSGSQKNLHPENNLLMVEAIERFIMFHHYLKLARELHGHLGECLSLSKGNYLPPFHARLLLQGSYSDLWLNRQDEFQYKISSLEDILNFTERSLSLNEASGDCKLPALHENACVCFYCDNHEYQQLVLETLLLKAEAACKNNSLELAEHFYSAATTYFQHHENRPIKDKLWSTYGYVLLSYSNFLFMSDRKTEAFNLNSKILESVSDTHLQNINLYCAALTQRANYLFESLMPKVSREQDAEHLEVLERKQILLTPDHKGNAVIIVTPVAAKSPKEFERKKGTILQFSPTKGEPDERNKSDLRVTRKTGAIPKRLQIAKLQMDENAQQGSIGNVLEELPVVDNTNSKTSDLLKSQTKLLTEKLKKGKNDAENNTEKRRRGPRKNLVKDFSDSTPSRLTRRK